MELRKPATTTTNECIRKIAGEQMIFFPPSLHNKVDVAIEEGLNQAEVGGPSVDGVEAVDEFFDDVDVSRVLLQS